MLFVSNQKLLKGYGIALTPMTTNAASVLHYSVDDVRNKLFKYSDHKAFAVVQAFTDGNDKAFESITKIAKATNYYLQRAEEASIKTITAEYYFPTVIIDGTLVECNLNEKSEIEINEIDYGSIIVKSSSLHKPCIVRILTLTGMNKYLKEWAQLSQMPINNIDIADLIAFKKSKK